MLAAKMGFCQYGKLLEQKMLTKTDKTTVAITRSVACQLVYE